MNKNTRITETQSLSALTLLQSSGIILYPTDTIWGIGCEATDEIAIQKIYKLKKREESKSLIILVHEESMIYQYVSEPSKKILEFLSLQTHPTTAIFRQAINLPKILVNVDGTIAIRIVQDAFCRDLINQLQKPLVSTSANVSGEKYPQNYSEISDQIKDGVDFIVQHRQNDLTPQAPSSLIRLDESGNIVRLR